jgi:hypothetical protein
MVGGWPAAVALGIPVVAVLVLLAWVIADGRRSRRLADLIQVFRTPAAPARSQFPAVFPKDWELPDLPADCAPGRAPELLTDTQARARMDYGLSREWTQRRIGEFAGRSATTVNKYKARVESAA